MLILLHTFCLKHRLPFCCFSTKEWPLGVSHCGKGILASVLCTTNWRETILIPTGTSPPDLIFHPCCPLAPTPVPPCSGCFYGEPAFSGGNGYRAVILVGTFTEATPASGLGPQIGQLAQDGVQHCPPRSLPPWGEGGGTAQLFRVTHSASQLLMTRSAPKKRKPLRFEPLWILSKTPCWKRHSGTCRS